MQKHPFKDIRVGLLIPEKIMKEIERKVTAKKTKSDVIRDLLSKALQQNN